MFHTLLQKIYSFLGSFSRKHFFALILVFVVVFVITFIPKNNVIYTKPLNLLSSIASLEKISGQNELTLSTLEEYGKNFDEFNGNREVEFTVEYGDTLSGYFEKEGLSGGELQKVLDADLEYLRLGNLVPEQRIKLLISKENQLLALKLFVDIATTLTYVQKENEYIASLVIKEGKWVKSIFKGEINGSFYINAKNSGLSPGQIRKISRALKSKIDFNRQLRVGDTFTVLVDKHYVDGESYESEVLAIIISTKKKNYAAFLHSDGHYYDNDAKGLAEHYHRRFPIDGKFRISSHFNRRRLHPVTGKIRPHNGTDFAVPTGTKVYSIGGGVVLRAGYHAAAGNYIVIKHGRKYVTRYLHLSKILVSKGQAVEMGDIIGRSGNTGRSTGAHLHYEFHVNNKPVNPLKVKLSLQKAVPK